MEGVNTALLVTEFAFQNWQTVLQLAATQGMLSIATFAADVEHFFTGVIPAVVKWGADNFFGLWRDQLNATLALFKSFGANVMNNMSALWKFIKTGGVGDLQLSWTPLLDGFESTIKELPNIPKREMGAVEKALTESRDALANNLGEGFATMKAKRDKEIQAAMQAKNLAGDKEATLGPQQLIGPDFGDPTHRGDNKPKSFAVSNAMKDSKESFEILMDSMRGKEKNDESKKQTKLQEKQLAALNRLNDGISALNSDTTETWSIA